MGSFSLSSLPRYIAGKHDSSSGQPRLNAVYLIAAAIMLPCDEAPPQDDPGDLKTWIRADKRYYSEVVRRGDQEQSSCLAKSKSAFGTC